MKDSKNQLKPRELKDRQLLETIGQKAIFKTRKKLLTGKNRDSLSELIKP
jgi:hypothetical protein